MPSMARPSNREKILEEGLKVVQERGFASSSVRDIVTAAGVPLGSFSNHFVSKDAFGLEIIDRYFAHIRHLVVETLRNDAKPPLARLREYIVRGKERQNCDGGSRGCLLGNFTAETGGASASMRLRLNEIYVELTNGFTYCLEAAVKTGEVSADLDCREIAGFIVSSLQGAMLLCKAEHTTGPIDRFERVLFSTILHR
jgi:TetR/AcrR family transcriptional repressor of nem operon